MYNKYDCCPPHVEHKCCNQICCIQGPMGSMEPQGVQGLQGIQGVPGPAGTTGVNLQAGSRTIATGDILKSEYGMVVVVGSNNSNPTFASLCKVEIASID